MAFFNDTDNDNSKNLLNDSIRTEDSSEIFVLGSEVNI